LISGALALGWLLFDTLRDAGEFRRVTALLPGPCEPVYGAPGAEDISFDPITGTAWISSHDRRAAIEGEPRRGAILRYDPDSDARPADAWPEAPSDFHPHGLSLYTDASGRQSLFVISHPGESLFQGRTGPGPAHTVEVFDVVDDRLVHRARLHDAWMISPNDLVAVDHQRFYFSNDHGSAPGWRRTMEDYLRLPWANVVHFDGREFREAAAGLSFANGIQISRDGESLYVAEVTRNRIREYRRDPASGALEERRTIEVGFGVDNLELDPVSGDLWLGGHLKLLTFTRHAADPSVDAPSMVARLRLSGAEPELTPVFIDDGAALSGASVGAVRDGVLLVGSVFEPHFLVCRSDS
jgi:arylesterase/paraoxonase